MFALKFDKNILSSKTVKQKNARWIQILSIKINVVISIKIFLENHHKQ